MQVRTATRDYLLVATMWLLLGTAFWTVQDDWSWNLLFPLTGFVWMAAPLLATRLRTTSLLITSGVLLLLAISIFLSMVWGALMVAGLFVSLVSDVDRSILAGIAGQLMIEGAKVVPGAALGALFGLGLRPLFTLTPRAE